MPSPTPKRLKFAWIAGGVLMAGFTFSPSLVRADEHEVRWDDVPHDVRRTLDHERADHKVSQIWDVHYPHHHFYRAIIEMPDGEHVYRVDSDGHLMTEQIDVPEERTWEEHWHHAHAGRSIEERDIPREIRHAIDRHIGRGHIRDVRQFDIDDLPVYQVAIEEHGDTRVLEILPDGTFIGEGEDIRRALRGVPLDDLPREAREAIRHEAGRVPIVKVYSTTRHDTRIFTAVAYEGHGDHRYITVTERGELVQDHEEHH